MLRDGTSYFGLFLGGIFFLVNFFEPSGHQVKTYFSLSNSNIETGHDLAAAKAVPEEEAGGGLGSPKLKPVSQNAVVDDAEIKCVHCKSSHYRGQPVKLFRCIEDPCANYFPHVCA